MKIFYIVASNGDGSSSVDFYDSKECIDYCRDESNHIFEQYMDGDGGSWGSFEVPDGTEFKGIHICSIEELKQR